MTLVKYYTIYEVQNGDGDFILARGKQPKTDMFMSLNEDTGNYDPVIAQRQTIDELPEPMSLSEYDQWADENAHDVLNEWVEENVETEYDDSEMVDIEITDPGES